MSHILYAAAAGLAVGFVVWFVTRRHYRNIMFDLMDEISKLSAEVTGLNEEMRKRAEAERKQVLKQQCIIEAVKEYQLAGSPQRVIDGYDLSEQEKAEVLKAVMLRVKGWA